MDTNTELKRRLTSNLTIVYHALLDCRGNINSFLASNESERRSPEELCNNLKTIIKLALTEIGSDE